MIAFYDIKTCVNILVNNLENVHASHCFAVTNNFKIVILVILELNQNTNIDGRINLHFLFNVLVIFSLFLKSVD